QIAKQLIDALSVDWEPEIYHDNFQETIAKIIKNKIRTGKVKEVNQEKPETTAKSNVVDFMSLLKKSIKTIDNKSVIKRKAG
ncbi:MAG: Ku protein, partial [Gammaproteobacteria bacterium]